MLDRSISDLLLALGKAATDRASWGIFLDKLATQLRARTATLYLRDKEQTRVLSQGGTFVAGTFPSTLSGLRFNRVYTTEELAEYDIRRPVAPDTLTPGERAMGAQFPTGEVWLHLSHPTREFRAQDSALLSSLLPHLAQAVGAFLDQERSDRNAARSAALLGQLSTGWVVFDLRGQILETDSVARGLIEAHLGTGNMGLTLGTEQSDALSRSLARVMSSTSSRERLRLRERPNVELLLTRDTSSPQVALGYLRLADPPLIDAATLAETLGVTLAEARLARALAAGDSIAVAAKALGLTIETARNYSKKIYAKTGLDGQTALIRHLWTGVALFRD